MASHMRFARLERVRPAPRAKVYRFHPPLQASALASGLLRLYHTALRRSSNSLSANMAMKLELLGLSRSSDKE